jgi:hypothetical protein
VLENFLFGLERKYFDMLNIKKISPFIPIIGLVFILYYENIKDENILHNDFVYFVSGTIQGLSILSLFLL